MRKCSNCGRELADEAFFCQYCGSKLNVKRVNYCDNCGAELSQDALFCRVCGNKVHSDELEKGAETVHTKKKSYRVGIAGAIILLVLICIIMIAVVRTHNTKKIGSGDSYSYEKSTELLKDSDFVADSYNQLGFYRYAKAYKELEDETDCLVNLDEDTWYMYFDDNSWHFEGDVITGDSVEFVLRTLYDDDDDPECNIDYFNKIRSDDEIIVYEQDYDRSDWDDGGDRHLLICVCNTNKVFDVYIAEEAFESFISKSGVSYEAIFTDETYQAFIDTLCFVGDN
jgi:hypothetical protein